MDTGAYHRADEFQLVLSSAAGRAHSKPADSRSDAARAWEKFNEVFPGGFTPSFGGAVTDWSIASGIEGVFDSGTSYDYSVHIGENRADFAINNTLNPSLGPQSPTEFEPGSYVQLEKNFNADFVTVIPMSSYDLNFAYGFEWREEKFEIVAVKLSLIFGNLLH